MPFPRVSALALVELTLPPQRRLRATSPSQMACRCARVKDDQPARLTKAAAPIRLLEIHEKALIESTHLLDGGATHEQAGADEPIDLLRRLIASIEQVVV